MEARITVIDNPVAQEILTRLRDKSSGVDVFRKCLADLGTIMGYEVARSMRTEAVTVMTPLGAEAKGLRLVESVVVVQVLRAAMPFVEGMLRVFPRARLGAVAARRVDETHRPGSLEFDVEISYARVPEISENDTLVLADPALATGSTTLAALRAVLEHGRPRRKVLVSVIATRQGINRVFREHPDAEFYTFSVDPELDERGYIVPGVGDMGDRAFTG